MSATSFAEFLGGKLNDLRNCVVAEYCAHVSNLECEASVLRSENGQLREQLKLCSLRSPQDAHDGCSQPFPETQRQAEVESRDTTSLQEDSKSEQQISSPEAADCHTSVDCGEDHISVDFGEEPPPRGSFSALSLPPLEPLEEGEEDEEQRARSSSVGSGASNRQQELLDNKDEAPVDLTVDLPSTLSFSPQNSAKDDMFLPVKLPVNVKTVHEVPEVTPWNSTSKPHLGNLLLPGHNGHDSPSSNATAFPHSSPTTPVADKVEFDFAVTGSAPAATSPSLTSEKLYHSVSTNSLQSASASSVKQVKMPPPAPSSPQSGSSKVVEAMQRTNMGKPRQSVVSVMSRAFNGSTRAGCTPGSNINGGIFNSNRTSTMSTLSVPARQSVLPVPSPKASIHSGTASQSSNHISSLDTRQAPAASAVTDPDRMLLDELEGGKPSSAPPSPRNSCTLASIYAPASDEANGCNNLNMPDRSNMAGKVHHEGEMVVQTESATLEDGEIVFNVWPVWTYTKDFGLTRKGAGETANLEDAMEALNDDSDDEEEQADVEEIHGWFLLRLFMRIIMHPTSPRRMLWDCLGVLCISYEFVMLPLQFLSLPQGPFILGAAWAMRIYWTCDFPLSFLTGYNRADGRVEKRPSKIAKNYASTWMPFDICVLTLDWLEIALGGLDGLGAARAGKAFKALRLLRMLRLIRLVRLRRMPEFMRVIAYKFQGERFVIVFGIIRIMIFLIGINHFIACCWYGIGDSTGDALPEGHRESGKDCEMIPQEKSSRGWVYEYNFNRQELGYRYVTSFHWSITQFTGSADIYPQNVGERTFTVMSLLFGFLLSASVVSSITSSMTRLQIVTARQSTQVSMLKQYLFDNGISTKVALRVQRNAMYTLSQATKNTPESSIELLSLVSEPLRMDLHYEIHMPILCKHPFFQCYNEVNSPAMKKVCHTCVSQLPLSRGDVLFSSGEIPPAPCTYFCISGKLQYLQEYGYRNGTKNMYAGNWSCEAVLWTAWVHIGMLRAKTECSLQLLSAGNFQSIATQFQTREFYPKKYAEAFVQQLNSMDKELLSDLATPDLDVDSICDMVFPRVRDFPTGRNSDCGSRDSRSSSGPVARIGRKVSKQRSPRSSKASTSSSKKSNEYDAGDSAFNKPFVSSGSGMGSSNSSVFGGAASHPSQASKASSVGRVSPSPEGVSRKDAVNLLMPPASSDFNC